MRGTAVDDGSEDCCGGGTVTGAVATDDDGNCHQRGQRLPLSPMKAATAVAAAALVLLPWIRVVGALVAAHEGSEGGLCRRRGGRRSLSRWH